MSWRTTYNLSTVLQRHDCQSNFPGDVIMHGILDSLVRLIYTNTIYTVGLSMTSGLMHVIHFSIHIDQPSERYVTVMELLFMLCKAC